MNAEMDADGLQQVIALQAEEIEQLQEAADATVELVRAAAEGFSGIGHSVCRALYLLGPY